jgi:hypothetical protein
MSGDILLTFLAVLALPFVLFLLAVVILLAYRALVD